MKNLYIAEKPSVAREFAKALGMKGAATAGARDGYLENEDTIVTWCVGHLITMSYPEVYDPALKKWSFDTIPFIPEEYKYEIIDASSKQFQIVSKLLNREDVGRIYVCTDSGREGEYIYRLVEQMAGVDKSKKDRRRVWIDSQTEEEIMRGIREAKELSAYDNLSDAAYLRAQEDYLMGINFSRAAQVQREIEFVRAREAEYHVMVDLLAAGKLPLRVTHNDTKLNNILFDKTTGEGLCVIDLDTVMPGLAANDFGDSIRFGANHCAEDEADLSKVNFSMELFEIYTKGFLQAAGEAFTPLEKQTLPWGAKLMTMECGMRFLADYLEGDHYFHINYETQNLNRARTQFKLTADMERNWDAMQKVIEKYC